MKKFYPEIKTDELKRFYIVEHLTLQEIGNKFGMTRQAIWNRLKKVGISGRDGEWCLMVCNFCGSEFKKVRSRAKKFNKHYCCQDCYAASLENSNSILCRNGQRLARRIVEQHIKLKEGYIVHHKDGNDKNNDIANLAVFSSQAEHIKYHRTKKAIPVWEGF